MKKWKDYFSNSLSHSSYRRIIILEIFIVILCFGIGFTSAELVVPSSSVKYKDSNVQEAMDDLYDKATAKLEEAKNECPPLMYCLSKDFANDSWDDIVKTIRISPGIYDVGTTKEIDMGEFGIHSVRIANNTTPSDCEKEGFSQTACGFVLEFADIITTHNMNSTDTNAGGWPGSELYTYLQNDIYNALPDDLKKYIIDTYVVSGYGKSDSSNFISNDKLYLLTTIEIGGTGYATIFDHASNYSRQLDYYDRVGMSASNPSASIKNYNGVPTNWWQRLADTGASTKFRHVTSGSSIDSGLSKASEINGVSPAFRIA